MVSQRKLGSQGKVAGTRTTVRTVLQGRLGVELCDL